MGGDEVVVNSCFEGNFRQGRQGIKKNYQIRIFTEIESFHPCHTLNVSKKFHPNHPQLFEISHDISFLARSLNGEESPKKFE